MGLLIGLLFLVLGGMLVVATLQLLWAFLVMAPLDYLSGLSTTRERSASDARVRAFQAAARQAEAAARQSERQSIIDRHRVGVTSADDLLVARCTQLVEDLGLKVDVWPESGVAVFFGYYGATKRHWRFWVTRNGANYERPITDPKTGVPLVFTVNSESGVLECWLWNGATYTTYPIDTFAKVLKHAAERPA